MNNLERDNSNRKGRKGKTQSSAEEGNFAIFADDLANFAVSLISATTRIQVTYSALFNDQIENPRNAGELPNANAVGEETNPVCGDRLRLSLRINKECIENVGFLAYGCAPTLACGSALTELLKGKTVEEALGLTRKNVIDAVGGLPARKQHAAALAIETLRSALSSQRDR